MPSDLTINEQTILPYETITVQVKATWAGTWADVDYLDPIDATLAVAPSISSAKFVFHYGTIKERADGDFWQRDPTDFRNWFVRIIGRRADVDADVDLFVGVFTDESFALHGSEIEPQGDQVCIAYGLEVLLDRIFISTAPAYSAAASAVVTLGTCPVYNRRRDYGIGLVGNRSSSQTSSRYVFHDADRAVWTHQDIAEQILADHSPTGVTFALDGQYTMLANVKSVVDLNGYTVRQALSHLIDRRRATGWWVPPTASGTVPVKVFSTLGTAVTVGSTTIPANTDQVNLSFGNAITPGQAIINTTVRAAYDHVEARGGPLMVCGSWAYGDATLDDGWTAAEETAYEAGSGESDATADEHDAERKTDKYERVFQLFRVPRDWDGRCGDGEGGTLRVALPSCSTAGVVSLASAASFWPGGKRFERFIPILKDAADTDARAEYRTPIVCCSASRDARWYQLDAIPPNIDDLSACRIRVANDEMAVMVEGEINHVLADDHFAGAEDTNTEPQFDFTDLIVTAFLAGDHHLRVRASAASPSGADKTLRIDVPDAQYWYVLQGTVTGIEDGELVKQGSTGNVIRNDVAVLEAVAALAIAWYGEPRAQMTLSIRQLVAEWIENGTTAYNLLPGDYVNQAQSADWALEDIGAVVSAKAFDFTGAGSVTYHTDWVDLDAAALVEFPGLSEPRAVAQVIRRHERELAAIREHVGHGDRDPAPPSRQVRFPAKIVATAPAGSIPTSVPVYAIKKVEPSNIGTPGDPDAAVTWSEVTGPAAVHWWATNIAEASDAHDLPDDEDLIVEVFGYYDGSTPPLRRLCFHRRHLTVDWQSFAGSLTLTTGSPGSYGVYRSVDDAGATPDEAITFYYFELDGDDTVGQTFNDLYVRIKSDQYMFFDTTYAAAYTSAGSASVFPNKVTSSFDITAQSYPGPSTTIVATQYLEHAPGSIKANEGTYVQFADLIFRIGAISGIHAIGLRIYDLSSAPASCENHVWLSGNPPAVDFIDLPTTT